MNERTNLKFNESQKFTQWWIWVPLIGLGLIPVYGLYKQLIKGEPFGSNQMSDIGLVLFAILMFAFLAFIYLITLKTEIDKDEIRIQFFPILRKTFKWEDVVSAEVQTYGFVGGWGIRKWTKYGTVYNIQGNSGLLLHMKNGRKYLIGTQKEAELKTFLSSIRT